MTQTRMLAVASGKGGVGKTWLAATLAHASALAGLRTLLFDGDLGLANVDVQLGLQPKGDLLSVVSGRLALADAATPFAGGAGHAGGFDVMAGRSGSGALQGLGPAEAATLGQSLKLAAARYDRTIVDLGAGLDGAVLGFAELAGRTLVVLTDEPTSLTDAYALVKLLRRREAAPSIAVAVNMAATEAAGARAFEALDRACRRFLGWSPAYAGAIRRDPRVREAIRAQSAFLTRSPSSPAAEDVRALAARLDEVFETPRPTKAAGVR